MENNFDPHNPKYIEKITQESKQAREQYQSDLQWLLENKQGRRIAWKLLGDCGVFQISMTGNSWTFFNEGKRSVGNKFLEDIMIVDKDAFSLMSKENSKAIKEE